ncbi:MAG: PEGA domain-containing protein [Gemmatimonadetes bacterium]|nr:MAG: PEGA domain-containing protein [Gemmatimonadota bacterium]
MSRSAKLVSLAVFAPAVVAACATIMHGTSQQVGINSQPAGATVVVDSQTAGTTPVAAKLARKRSHRITVTMPGYQQFEMVTTRKTSGWVWGNIVFGGLIGLIVDASTGGLYDVRPEQVNAQLARTGASGEMRDGMIYVFLVREVDPSWVKIGQLKPIEER